MEAITTILYGRLANQMHAIATCIATALRNDVEYIIPRFSANPRKWPTYFKFPRKKIDKIDRVWKPTSHRYSEIFYNGGVLELDGGIECFFQSEKYYKDYREEIINEFHKYGLPYVQPSPCVVSVHVRRGDYLQLKEYHPPVTVEYITEAMEYMRERGYDRFRFFSDDIKWCKENFPGHEYSERNTALKDLMLMAGCDSHILSNSSYSKMAAELSKYPEKIVIAPKVWFGSELQHDTTDLLPEEWIKI